MTPIKNICYAVITLTTLLLALMLAMVAGEDCGPTCGFVAPTTFTAPNLGCPEAGDTSNATDIINWSDGSSSTIDFSATIQIAVGSCCSQLQWSDYETGIVTDGKFLGQTAILVINYMSDNQMCDECQTSSGGIARSTGDVLLAIGTKGVSPWIECSGNLTELYSPLLTPPITPNTFITYTIDYTDCSTCVMAC